MRTQYIYKTTCAITGKFYIGKHSTKYPNRKYYGSGIRIVRSLKKYGKDNHTVEILEYAETDEYLNKREKEIVTDELLSNPLCLNLRRGGDGGFSLSSVKASHRARKEKSAMDDTYRSRISNQNRTKRLQQMLTQNEEERRSKISQTMKDRLKDPAIRQHHLDTLRRGSETSKHRRKARKEEGQMNPLNAHTMECLVIP